VEQSVNQKINWDAWLREIRAIGFTNPLLNFEPNAIGQIDLERAHPSGTAQLSATKLSVLSNLFRDPLAFSRAYSAAKRIKSRAENLDNQLGVQALALVAGLVNLEHDGFDLSMPILIWPISLVRKTDDFEVTLHAGPRVNPGLVDALEFAYGVRLDEGQVLATLGHEGDFVPLALLEYISSAVGAGAKLETRKILAIGNFSSESIELTRDVDRQESALLRKLDGLDREVEPATDSGILPAVEAENVFLVADADATQQRVVARVVAGQSFAVETLPGCGYTQTLVNAVAAAAQAGKSVLVVAPRRQTLNELADRFASLGLGGLAVRATHTWLDVIGAISRHEKSTGFDLAEARLKREVASIEVEKYLGLLGKRDEKIQLTVSEALVALAKLSLVPRAPETSARISASHLLQHRDRSRALTLLYEAEQLGEFKFTPKETPWFRAKFENEQEATAAVALAKRLATDALANLSQQFANVTAKVSFKAATSVQEWGEQLQLLTGVRETLGRFVPEVFNRPLVELIAATGPRTGKDEISGSNRRRLKKLAKEYVRKGMPVSDIHQSLISVQEQREAWARFAAGDIAPEVPAGITDLMVAYQAFVSDLGSLQNHLDDSPSGIFLTRLPLRDLSSQLTSMAQNAEPLAQIDERNAIRAQLKDSGLDELARDLAALKVRRENIALELDLAWWQSALEYLVARDSSVMQYTAEQIDSIEEDFTIADAKLVEGGPRALAGALSQTWTGLLSANAQEAEELKKSLRTRFASLRSIAEVAPNLSKSLLQVVMVSPYELPAQISRDSRFDVAFVLDAGGTTVAENLAALSRVDQVVVFGDEAIAAPDGFEVEWHETPLHREDNPKSIFSVAKDVFFREVLRKSWRPNGQALGSLINREFYQNRIDFVPTAFEFTGQGNLKVEVLTSGIGSNTKGTSAVESPDAEVDRVTTLVLEHAESNQAESLLVATASRLHADRIESALNNLRKSRPELDEWFDSHGREKFEVTPISALSHRSADRIIFSVGFGVDGSGAAPSELGDLTQTFGRRYLANMLVSARTRIDIISCIGAEHLAGSSPLMATHLLQEVLSQGPADEDDQTEFDPLLEDLALRLKKLGARAVLNFRGSLPLVVAYANKSAVILPDWNLAGESLSEKLRLRPALLRTMGWRVIRVHTFELFSDPAALAVRIGESLGMQLTKRPQPLFDSAAFDETPEAWGDRSDDNDARLKGDKPPHWG